MKIIPKDFKILKDAIAVLDTKERREYYMSSISAQDINKRYRWDLLYATGLSRFICDVLYKYMDDTHVDTALRTIVPLLERKAS